MVPKRVAVTGDAAWLHPGTFHGALRARDGRGGVQSEKNRCTDFHAPNMDAYMSEARYCVRPSLRANAGMVTDHAQVVSYTEKSALQDRYGAVVGVGVGVWVWVWVWVSVDGDLSRLLAKHVPESRRRGPADGCTTFVSPFALNSHLSSNLAECQSLTPR